MLNLLFEVTSILLVRLDVAFHVLSFEREYVSMRVLKLVFD